MKINKLKIFIYSILLIIFITIYARYFGTSGLVTKEYSLNDNNLPLAFDGLKIVHFSDIHYKRAINEKKVKNIIKEINLINPDIIIFTGDLIDEDTILTENDYKFLTNSLSELNSTYGKYAILGNHDYSVKDKILEIYQKSNFIYLENNYDIIEKNSTKLFLGGLGNVTYNEQDINKLSIEEKCNYSIILTHEPDIADEITNKLSPNMILAGHSHKGQVYLPGIGGIIKPPNAKKYYKENYQISNTNLYISSGVGVSILNYRLFNHPSINFYRLNKKEA